METEFMLFVSVGLLWPNKELPRFRIIPKCVKASSSSDIEWWSRSRYEFRMFTSASFHFVPSMMTLKRQGNRLTLITGAARGSLVNWGIVDSNRNVLAKMIQRFVRHMKTNIEIKICIILDRYSMHSKHLVISKIARKDGVLILRIFWHFQGFHNTAVIRWLQSYSDQNVT